MARLRLLCTKKPQPKAFAVHKAEEVPNVSYLLSHCITLTLALRLPWKFFSYNPMLKQEGAYFTVRGL